ncbi:MAG: 2-C-methyl-D-erythritol 4-phosphate cytidylyltransferase [Coprobacillus sp.]|nr:2-C-methyl-D-erythritol 4-phosphate cytidylyltransferase [Coprobacillus sp.]
MKNKVRNVAILLIGGQGTRLKFDDELKQFHLVNGKPLFMYSYETLVANNYVDEIIIVTAKETIDLVHECIAQVSKPKTTIIVEGGATRQESSLIGLLKVKDLHLDEDLKVLIHDGDRPLVSEEIINQNFEKVSKSHFVCTILKINDSIANIDNDTKKTHYLTRDDAYLIQTPQTFANLNQLVSAHLYAKKHNKVYTDDCRLLLDRGGKVEYVEGSPRNFKVTTKEDLNLLEELLSK